MPVASPSDERTHGGGDGRTHQHGQRTAPVDDPPGEGQHDERAHGERRERDSWRPWRRRSRTCAT